MNALPISLDELAPLPVFVAWRTEMRGTPPKPTKVPYAPGSGRRASSTDPATWGTRAAAEARAAQIVNGHGGGVGLILATLPTNAGAAGGVDLDTCRDPTSGDVQPWATEVIERYASYAEVSPSQTGIKIFFTFDPADLPMLKAMMGTQGGRAFKRKTNADHPPSIELYLAGRYFAVTGNALPTSPAALRPVSVDTLLWLLADAGPAFEGKPHPRQPADDDDASEDADEDADEDDPTAVIDSTDGSRSAQAFRKGTQVVHGGADFEAMCAALRDDPTTAQWMREKGEANNRREARRIFTKAKAPPNGHDGGAGLTADELEERKKLILEKIAARIKALMARFNRLYMMVNDAGKAIILQPGCDEVLNRRIYTRLTVRDFETLYLNQTIVIGLNKKGEEIRENVARFWLRRYDRHQYIKGVTFDPTTTAREPGVLNLWEGFAVKSAPGDWSLLRTHIEEVICDNDPTRIDYLMRWIARMFQRPAEQGEVAVVMKGGEGAGKGTLANILLRMVGQHGYAVSHARHLVGHFNAHLRDVIFLFADEAFFAGDKQNIGALKALITEPELLIEGKFQNAVRAPNRLHVMMASNEDWVVPASTDARRFFVLEVGDARTGDHDYFEAIWKQMKAGGFEAMLHDMLALDISAFNVRAAPTTEGLQQQRRLSLPTTEAWWADCLERGYVFNSKLGLEETFKVWMPFVATELLVLSYQVFAKEKNERRPLSRVDLGRFFVSLKYFPMRPGRAPVNERPVANTTLPGAARSEVYYQERPTGYVVGELTEARHAFDTFTGLPPQWSKEE